MNLRRGLIPLYVAPLRVAHITHILIVSVFRATHVSWPLRNRLLLRRTREAVRDNHGNRNPRSDLTAGFLGLVPKSPSIFGTTADDDVARPHIKNVRKCETELSRRQNRNRVLAYSRIRGLHYAASGLRNPNFRIV